MKAMQFIDWNIVYFEMIKSCRNCTLHNGLEVQFNTCQLLCIVVYAYINRTIATKYKTNPYIYIYNIFTTYRHLHATHSDTPQWHTNVELETMWKGNQNTFSTNFFQYVEKFKKIRHAYAMTIIYFSVFFLFVLQSIFILIWEACENLHMS